MSLFSAMYQFITTYVWTEGASLPLDIRGPYRKRDSLLVFILGDSVGDQIRA